MVAAALISAGASLLGGLFGSRSAKKQDEMNYQRQKEFAQKSIQWKVADATKAGIHPIYALGAQPMSFAPSTVGDGGVGASIADAGQHIGRAVAAGSSGEQRATAFDTAVRALTLQKMGLENDLLASQIRTINQPALGPGLPVNGNDDPIVIGGKEVARNPNFSDAQVIQDRYGEWGENLYSLPVIGADLYHDQAGKRPPTASDWWGAVKRGYNWFTK